MFGVEYNIAADETNLEVRVSNQTIPKRESLSILDLYYRIYETSLMMSLITLAQHR